MKFNFLKNFTLIFRNLLMFKVSYALRIFFFFLAVLETIMIHVQNKSR